MKEVIKTHRNGYIFGASFQPDTDLLDSLIKAIHQPEKSKSSILGGRGVVSKTNLAGVGPVLIKHYKRGGLLRYFVRNYYLKWGDTRPEQEFRLMAQVRDLGVSVPEPIAFIYKGCGFYKGWTVSKLIVDEQSLAEISLNNDEQVIQVIKELAEQIVKLINNKICHIDLHPGNVLIDSQGSVSLVDFDKAYIFRGSKNSLRDFYLCRWRRAVIKHNLPDILSELFSAGLRKNYDSGVKYS